MIVCAGYKRIDYNGILLKHNNNYLFYIAPQQVSKYLLVEVLYKINYKLGVLCPVNHYGYNYQGDRASTTILKQCEAVRMRSAKLS